MLTYRDYVKLATAFKRARHVIATIEPASPDDSYAIVLGEVIAELSADNPLFSETLFREATK